MRFVLLLLPWFFLACSSPQVFVSDHNEIGLSVDGSELSVTAEKKLEERINLDSLMIVRTLYLLKEGNPVVVETARADAAYQFQYDAVRTLQVAFDAQFVRRIDRVGNVGFYAVKMKQGSELYTIAQNQNKQAYTIIYGLSAAQMMTALKHVSSDHFDRVLRGTVPVITLPDSKEAFLTRWNAKMEILDGLLERKGGRPRGL